MRGNPLQNARGVVVSLNGSVYTTGSEGANGNFLGFVSHFFAGAGGRLAYDGCISNDGTGGSCADIPGNGTPVQAPTGLAVSPNGGSVYVSSSATLSHFFAAAGGGQLKWDACASNDGSGGSCIKGPQTGSGDPFGFPTAVAVSPDGSAPNSSVYFVSLGVPTGTLTLDGTVAHLFADPVGGQLNWDGCVSNDGSGGTCAALPGAAADTGPLADPNAVAVNPSGSAVYVTAGSYATFSTGEGTILQFSALPSGGGGLTKLVGCLSDTGTNGCTKVSGAGAPLTNSGGVAVSPDGASVYVASGVGVSHFYADPKGTGLLSFDGCVSDDGSGGACTKGPQSGDPLAGADAVAVSPDGRSVYVVSAKALSWFTVAPQGQLTFQGCMSDDSVPGCIDPPGQSLSGADAVAVSPDGGSVYVTSQEGIAHFFRAQSSGGGGSGGSGGGGGGGGGGTHPTRTITAKIDNQLITVVTSLGSACVARSGSLSATLTSAAIPGSTATKLRSTGAAFSIDRGVRHVHHRTVRRHGNTVVLTTTTYTPNVKVGKPPTNVSLKLAGLSSRSHVFNVKVSYHATVKRHGHRHTVSVSKTLSLTFQVC